MKTSRFILFYSLFVLLTALIILVLKYTLPFSILVQWFWCIFAFIAISTLLSYLFSTKGINKGGETSILTLMAVSGIKLFLSMGAAIVYLLNFKVNGTIFIANFFSLYFLFTAFELYFLLRNLRHQKLTEKS